MTESPSDAAAQSLTDKAARELRQMILRHELAPGERIHQTHLGRRMGLSQTPLREALARLAAEGWVHYYSQRGARVADLSKEALCDLYDVREQLEPIALQKSIEAASDEWLAEVGRTYLAMSAAASHSPAEMNPREYDVYEAGHVHFHKTLLANCGSPWLIRFTGMLIDQSGRYRRMSITMPNSRHDSVEAEHAEIYEAVVALDGERAAQLIRQHSERTRISIASIIEESESTPDAGDTPSLDSARD